MNTPNDIFADVGKDIDAFLQKKKKPLLAKNNTIAKKFNVPSMINKESITPPAAIVPSKPKQRKPRSPNKRKQSDQPAQPVRNFILAEAARLVHGDRAKTYSTPKIDWTCAAAMMTAAMRKKYPDSNITFEAEDVGVLQICLKLSRQMNGHKHDNLVDIAGYAECIAWLREENEEDANGEV